MYRLIASCCSILSGCIFVFFVGGKISRSIVGGRFLQGDPELTSLHSRATYSR